MSDKIKEELKPCPVCNSKAILITSEKDKRRQTNKIECTNKPCISITRAAMFGVDDIIHLWNRRPPQAEIKKLRKALDRTGLLAKNIQTDNDIGEKGLRFGCGQICDIAIEALKE